MQVLTLHGPGDVRLDEIGEPVVGDQDVVMEIAACGICGSDLSYIRWGSAGPHSVSPMPLGHEAAGVVTAVGAGVRDVAVGDRMILNPMGAPGVIGNGGEEGAFAPSLLVRGAVKGRALFAMPEAMSFEVAALVEPLAVSMHAVNRSGARAGQSAVVFGVGPIGLGIVLWLRQRGLTHIIAVDLSAERLAIARKLGASATIRADEENVQARIAELQGAMNVMGRNAAATDLYFDAAGAAPIIPQVVGMAAPGAKLVIVAVYEKPVALDVATMLSSELTIMTSMGYPEEFPAVIAALEDLADEAVAMITSTFPFERMHEALDCARLPGAGKVMVRMGSS